MLDRNTIFVDSSMHRDCLSPTSQNDYLLKRRIPRNESLLMLAFDVTIGPANKFNKFNIFYLLKTLMRLGKMGRFPYFIRFGNEVDFQRYLL